MRKVLIVTYYWPPSGGSGVQRWLKFVKYLPLFGWEPHVFTPENPTFQIKDLSLERDVPQEAEIIRFPIWEPYNVFFFLSRVGGRKTTSSSSMMVTPGKRTFFEKVSAWIRGNFFVPDPRRFWVKPSVTFLSEYLERNGIDTVITTGPPHSIHLIGLRLKLKYPHLRWLADFRDPWTEWGMWEGLMLTRPVKSMHRRLEAKVLKHADEILTITPFYQRRFQSLSGRQVHLLTNGFDEEDFKDLKLTRGDKFIARHVGLINERCDPRPFMDAIAAEVRSDPKFAREFRLEFIGDVNAAFRHYVETNGEMSAFTVFKGSIPHDELIRIYGSSSLLVLILTGYKDPEGFLPGKLFEYVATGIPVLGVGPEDGDAANLLRETRAGVMVSENDDKIRSMVRKYYEEWKRGEQGTADPSAKKFSRRGATELLVKILSDRNGVTSARDQSNR